MKRARSPEAKDARRQAVLAAALDEFFERGYSAARMVDIARRIGVSKGTLYLYFDSKEALFTALIDEFAVPNVERLATAAEEAGGGVEAIRALTRFAPVLVRQTPAPKIIKVLISDAFAFPHVVSEYRRRVVERVLQVIAGVLEKARAEGELDVDDPYLTARLVAAPIFMSAVWRVIFERDADARIDVEALFAIHEKMLLRALKAEAGS